MACGGSARRRALRRVSDSRSVQRKRAARACAGQLPGKRAAQSAARAAGGDAMPDAATSSSFRVVSARIGSCAPGWTLTRCQAWWAPAAGRTVGRPGRAASVGGVRADACGATGQVVAPCFAASASVTLRAGSGSERRQRPRPRLDLGKARLVRNAHQPESQPHVRSHTIRTLRASRASRQER